MRSGVADFASKFKVIRMVGKTGCRGASIGVALLALLLTGSAQAADLALLDVASGYSGCRWVDHGGGDATVFVDVHFKGVRSGIPAGAKFRSRGLLVYSYDENGVAKPITTLVRKILLNNSTNNRAYFLRDKYVLHYSEANFIGWVDSEDFVAHFEISLNGNLISSWPAISVRAGNATNRGDVAEVSGAAYIRLGDDSGVCEIVNTPDIAGPLDIKIGMTAPDWNLGELPRGDSEKTFPEVANQLCFTYSGASVKGRRFIVNASNANGVVGNRYRLKNMSDASQYVPYDLALSGATSFPLPNSSDVALTMDPSGKTCFVPTFKTTVDNKVKDGDYSDVLTFTVVTQP
ncbi:hypothetical protein AB4851_20325 [Burkholderia sp. 22PA0099]|uniref:hypothetical protein n=1 Tax=Burkholderia sp. 22PA0099 TaxID=3237372 RepID=UPI0039C02170